MAVRKGLGRGLDSMFPRYTQQDQETSSQNKKTLKESGKEDNSTVEKERAKKQSTNKAGSSGNRVKEKKTQNDESVLNRKTEETRGTVPGMSENLPGADGTLLVKISEIEPNADQPRRDFNEDALQELAESIKQVGILQPIIVQKRNDYYEIIAGERRWRAARLAGLKEVPVLVKDLSHKEILELSLIENLQREDLNAIEEAKGYKRLIEEFALKQDELAERLSKSRAAITNSMRLLKLSDKVQEMLIEELISAGHARALLAIEDPQQQEAAATKVFDEKLSVRETEKMVKSWLNPKKEKESPRKPDEATRLIYKDMEEKLRAALGTKVTVHYGSGQKGKLEIEYYSSDELERIYDLLRFGTGM